MLDPRGMVPFIRDAAQKYGIDPDVAVKVAASEGLSQFTSGIPGENSYGAFQLNTQGGLGNEFQKSTGLDPSDPKNEQATIDYALRHASQNGWSAFHGARNRYGWGPWVGIGGAPIQQAFAQNTTGKTPMADYNNRPPALSPEAMQDNPPVLFGGNPTPVGAFGALGRMLGIGTADDLGRRLQNAGAGLIAVGNPSGGAALQNAANMPLFRQNYSVVSDPYGGQHVFSHKTGTFMPTPGGMMQGAAGAPQAAAPQAEGAPQADNTIPMSPPSAGELQTQALANTPKGMLLQNEEAIKTSNQKYEALQESYNEAQKMKQMAEEALALAKDENVHQGPGGHIIGTLKSAIQNTPVIGASLPGADQSAALDKIFNRLQGQYLKTQKGVRFAGPEISFSDLANASLEKPRATNIQILQDTIREADRAMGALTLANQYRAANRILGPQFANDLKRYWDTHPASKLDAVQPSSNSEGAPTFKILKVH